MASWLNQGPLSTHNYKREFIENATVATDGSGGPRWIPKHVRKAASAVSFVSFDSKEQGEATCRDVAILMAALPGKQTVPRAELWAATMAVDSAQDSSHHELIIQSDSSYVVRGAESASRFRMEQGGNGDLWEEFHKQKQQRCLIAKVKAHNEFGVLSGQAEVKSYVANSVADAAADAMAEHTGNTLEAQTIDKVEAWLYQIAMRIAILECEAREALPEKVVFSKRRVVAEPLPVCVRLEQLREAIQAKGHIVIEQNGKTRCRRCKRIKCNWKVAEWANTHCVNQVETLNGSAPRSKWTTAECTEVTEEVTGSREQRARESAKIRKDIRDLAAQDKSNQKKAGNELLEEIQAGNALPTLTKCEVPFAIHPSHGRVIYVGGYASCPKCGKVASRDTVGNGLKEVCRNWCPRGSVSRIKRMRNGGHPHSGSMWPTGEAAPKPYIVGPHE